MARSGHPLRNVDVRRRGHAYELWSPTAQRAGQGTTAQSASAALGVPTMPMSDQVVYGSSVGHRWTAHAIQVGHPCGGSGMVSPASSAASGAWNFLRHERIAASGIGKVSR